MNQFFGGLLLAAGILIMTCSGLCSLFVIIISFQTALPSLGQIMLPLIIGGTPFAAGFGLFRWGRSLLRKDDEDQF